MKKKTWKVHDCWNCRTCGKSYENYKNAQALAAKHARSRGHRVTGNVGLAYEYDGGEPGG